MTIIARNLRWLGIAALVIAYSVLANYTNQSESRSFMGALVAIAPVALVLVLFSWRSARRTLMLGLLLLAGATLWQLWPLLMQHYGWLYWLEHESVQWLLFLTFARTLFANRQPLCNQFAEIMHGPLTLEHARYAHRVTIAWALFFASMILISTGLFFWQPLAIWSVFANFIFLPLVILMFVVEYAVRKQVLPELEHADFMAAINTYMQHGHQRH